MSERKADQKMKSQPTEDYNFEKSVVKTISGVG